MFQDVGSDCLRTSLWNGMVRMVGSTRALEMRNREIEHLENERRIRGHYPRVRSLRDLEKGLRERHRILALQYIRLGEQKVNSPGVKFFIEQWQRGVFLVIIRSACNLMHSICVDTRCDPAMILDGAEKHPMWCSQESFELCVGENLRFEGIEEARELVALPERDPTKPPKKKKKKFTSDRGSASNAR